MNRIVGNEDRPVLEAEKVVDRVRKRLGHHNNAKLIEGIDVEGLSDRHYNVQPVSLLADHELVTFRHPTDFAVRSE